MITELILGANLFLVAQGNRLFIIKKGIVTHIFTFR